MTAPRERPHTPFDPNTREFSLNPAPYYEELRDNFPVSWHAPSRTWYITRYTDVLAGFRHPRLLVMDYGFLWSRLRDKYNLEFPNVLAAIPYFPFAQNGARHARLRRSFAHSVAPFLHREAQVSARIERVLSGLRNMQRFDFASDFAACLLFEIMCDMAEIPEARRPQLAPLASVSWLVESALRIDDRSHLEEVLGASHRILEDELREQLDRSTSSLLTSIYRNLPADEIKSTSAAAWMFAIMLVMGNDALAGTLGFGVQHLLDNRAQNSVPQSRWATLADDMVRFTAPVDMIARVAETDARLGGCPIAAGELIGLSTYSANRDPRQFGQHAGEIAWVNSTNVGLSFGAGIHSCIGMPIARKVIRLALAGLERFPTLKLDGDGIQTRGKIIRSLSSLPVRVQ